MLVLVLGGGPLNGGNSVVIARGGAREWRDCSVGWRGGVRATCCTESYWIPGRVPTSESVSGLLTKGAHDQESEKNGTRGGAGRRSNISKKKQMRENGIRGRRRVLLFQFKKDSVYSCVAESRPQLQRKNKRFLFDTKLHACT